MNVELIKSASTIAFLVIIALFAIISLLAAYVFIRYGRTPSITILTSIAFGGVFILGTLTAYLTLQTVF